MKKYILVLMVALTILTTPVAMARGGHGHSSGHAGHVVLLTSSGGHQSYNRVLTEEEQKEEWILIAKILALIGLGIALAEVRLPPVKRK